MMLPKLDTFVLLTNEGPSLDKKDEPWSKIKHGDDGMRGCACFLVSRLEVAPDGGAGGVEVEDARGVHDEDRPAENLVRANVCRSCTSHLALQARWNKRVILVYSLYSRMV